MRLQKLNVDLDKCINMHVRDYEAIDNILKDIIKILEKNNEMDLHILRQIRSINYFAELCKAINLCHKNDFNILVLILNNVTKILTNVCS